MANLNKLYKQKAGVVKKLKVNAGQIKGLKTKLATNSAKQKAIKDKLAVKKPSKSKTGNLNTSKWGE